MVNVYGVVNQSRYMPDRRDLNRCFPGSEKGSLAGRVAFKFLNSFLRAVFLGLQSVIQLNKIDIVFLLISTIIHLLRAA